MFEKIILRKKNKKISDIIKYASEFNKIKLNDFNGKISVVMLTMDRLEDTKKSIKALYQNIKYPFQFIILDNGSKRETIQYLKNLETEKNNVTVIFEKENLGCAGGRRKAFSLAKGDFVLSIDNDIILTPYAIWHLIKTLIDNPKSAGVCCKTVFPNGKIQFNGGRMDIAGRFVKFSLVDGEKYFNEKSTFNNIECDWIPGGATMWKKEIVEKFSIDSEMKGSHEDNDFSITIRKAGFEIYNCPKAIAIHNHIYFNANARKEKSYIQKRYNKSDILHALTRFYVKHDLIIKDGFLPQFGLDIDDDEKIISFFDRNASQYQDFTLLKDRNNMENINIFTEKASIFSEKKSKNSEKELINLWNLFGKKEKVAAFKFLQEKKIIADWIEVIFKNGYFSEIELLSKINFSDNENKANNKKIAFYINRLYNGGREKVVQQLANNFVDKGWQVVIFTIEDKHEKDYKLDPRIKRIVLNKDKSTFLSGIYDKMNELSINIFASHNWLDNKELLMFAYLRAKNIKVCLSDHIGLYEQTMIKGNNEGIKNLLNSINIINGLTCLSKLETLIWRKFGQNVAFMPNPIELFESKKNVKKNNQIVWVGRLEKKQKRPEDAIRAFSIVHSKIPEAELIIVGAEENGKMGNYYNDLKKLCKKLDCEKEVRFIGFSDNVSGYLSESSIHWLTSKYEGFPMVWVEAKSSGIPTILYDMPWIELNGKGSIVVDQGDYQQMGEETIRLLNNRKALNDLSIEARCDLLHRFDPKEVIERWSKFYQEILSEGNSVLFYENYDELIESEKKYFRGYIENILSNKVEGFSTSSKFFGETLEIMKMSSPSDFRNKVRFAIFSPKKFVKKYLDIFFK